MADAILGDELDEEASDARQTQLAEYVKQLGWEAEEGQSGGSRYTLRPPAAREGMTLTLRLGQEHLWICVPDLVAVDRRARREVLWVVAQIHWETFLPKFELSPMGSELRASWWLPALLELPPFSVFEETLRAVCEEVDRQWERLHEANRQTSHVASIRDSGERLAEAAALSNLGRNLVELAKSKEILPMYVREDLVRQVIALLDGPRRQVLLVGEPGTGKNAVVYALATWIATGDMRVASSSLKNSPIYECTPASFQSACLYAHELETKIGIIAQNCLRENAVLFLDSANLAVTAGRLSENPERTIANLLLPVLSRGEIAIVAATTPVGLQTMQRTNPQFTRLFQVVSIPEPTVAETKQMVRDRIAKVEAGLVGGRAYQVTASVVDTVVSVAGEFLRSRRFPGKALELLNEVLALKGMQGVDSPVCDADVYATLERYTGLSSDLVHPDRPVARQDVEGFLARQVLGQPDAVRRVADVVLTLKAGLVPTDRPIANLLFVGPTGVGKTQLARSLAILLFGSDEAMLRYDMSEYAGADGFYKLCGSVGAQERSGRLPSDVTSRQFSVILFDEIEKAHPMVFDALLQVLGEGRMTDEAGRLASFLNTVIILTSNVGGHLYHEQEMGLTRTGEAKAGRDKVERALRAAFRPEFMNRVEVVHFAPLPEAIVRRIAQREVERLGERRGLRSRRLTLEVDEAVIEEVIRRGYDRRYGARAMQRAVEALLTAPLSDLLARHPELAEACIGVGWEGEEVVLRVG